MSETQRSSDLVRNTLQLVALAVLIVGSLWILRPFLIAGIWATTIAIATWPLLLRFQGWLGGRRWLAVTAMTLLLLAVLVVPLWVGVSAIARNVAEVERWSRELSSFSIPSPPEWLSSMPIAGERIATEWRALAAESPEELAARVGPYLRDLARWLVYEVGNIGALFVQFLLTVVLSALLWANGESAARGMRAFARRLAGQRGEEAADLAAQAIRAVALGVVVTAVVQTALVAAGLAVVGVPFAAILSAVCFVLSIAQIGPIPVLIGTVIWAFMTQPLGWAIAFLVWALLCSTIDNVIRPVLIRRGADLPLLLIFGGVIGGLVAFGVIGLFIGPVVLAVGYMLLLEWMKEA